MGERDLEGIDRRLHEQHDKIDVSSERQRNETAIADIEGIEQVVTPPRELIQKLDGTLEGALCGQKYQVVWPSGPWKDLPITGYCAEPLCITEGACTGTRFVPHIDQWTTTDPSTRRHRVPDRHEVVAAVRSFAKRAAAETGRDEERSDREILDHVKLTWTRTIQHIRGKGGWRQS